MRWGRTQSEGSLLDAEVFDLDAPGAREFIDAMHEAVDLAGPGLHGFGEEAFRERFGCDANNFCAFAAMATVDVLRNVHERIDDGTPPKEALAEATLEVLALGMLMEQCLAKRRMAA